MKKTLRIIIGFLITVNLSCEKGDTPEVEFIPGDVSLISPFQNESCEEGINSQGDKSRLFFEWSSAENTETYDLIVTDPSTGEEIITYREIRDTEKELELTHNRAYSWQVISKNSRTDKTGSSPSWNFFFVGEPQSNYTPFPARVIYPESFQSLSLSEEKKLLLKWQGSDPDNDELTYTIYLDKIDGMQEPVEQLKNLSETTVEVELDQNTTYYWRIKTYDGRSSSFTSIYSFSTE